MQEQKTICDLVREMEKTEEFGDTQISEHVSFDMRGTLEKIDAYLNSKHVSGETDSLGRKKPFFNVVTSAVNVWYRATDIDRKNIRILASRNEQTVMAFLTTVLLQEWMRKNKFGLFLNEWGRTLARYGSAVSKHVEKGGELISEVIPWNRMLCDAVDFENNLVVEKLWLTAGQLRNNKKYDQELVKHLLDNPTVRETNDGQKKDTKDDYFLVYEVHGELPIAFLKDSPNDIEDKDWEEFTQQMHVITLQTEEGEGGEPEDFTLFKGRERKNPYHLAHLIPEDGRTLAIGAVEHLFEAQWQVNHTIKQIRDQLDLASKILFQTSDGNFSGKNALVNIQNGEILTHAVNMPLTMLNNKPDISAMQATMSQWQQQGMQEVNINEAMTTAPKSGTAWRQTQAALQEAHSLFELMLENKGLYIEEILREFVIPFFEKKMDTKEELGALLEENQIDQLNSMYMPNEITRRLNEIKKDIILSGEIYDPSIEGDLALNEEQLIKKSFEPLKNQRFFKPDDIDGKTWKDAIKDMEKDLVVDITGEVKDIQGALATLTTVFQTLITNPQALLDPNIKLVFSNILNLAGGISPLEIKEPQPMQAQPA
jgi:hypothetical protein